MADIHGTREELVEMIVRLTAENEKLIKTFGEIERIANIAPADNSFGSLAERMGKVWLLARGHEQ